MKIKIIKKSDIKVTPNKSSKDCPIVVNYKRQLPKKPSNKEEAIKILFGK